MGLKGVRHVGHARRDEDHAAACAFQLLERGARRIERAEQVDVDDALEAVGRQLFGRDEEVARGAADEDINGTELLAAARQRRLECRDVAHVGGHRADLRTERAQFLGRRVELGLRAAADRDLGAERGEVFGHAEVDAAAASGHKHRLVLEQFAWQQALDRHLMICLHDDSLGRDLVVNYRKTGEPSRWRVMSTSGRNRSERSGLHAAQLRPFRHSVKTASKDVPTKKHRFRAFPR
jgi:hypothetical protein